MALPISTNPTLPPLVDQARRLMFGDGVLLRQVADAAGGLAVNLALAGLILAGTIWAANWLSRLAARAIRRAHRHTPTDATLQTFAASLVRYVVVIVGLVAVLQQLGVKATSVIAVLGAASLAIGLALQGALSNVAAGVMILILRPYRVGDTVEINGQQGTVKGLDLFSTRLASGDNLSVFVPNAKAFGEIIINLSSPVARRVQLDFTIDYADDVDCALEIMLACAAAEPRVTPKPAPWAKLTALADSGVTVSLRAWLAPKDFDDGRYDLMKAVRDRLEGAGFSFPYPHQVAVAQRPFEPPHAQRAVHRPVESAGTPPARPRPPPPRPARASSAKGR
ncbi:MAG: mechanosensitive ion channel family protein [Caulobacterales bacterium]